MIEFQLTAETGADKVGGLVDPSRTPLHGCVVYQDEALLAVAPGAAEACQACIRGCLRVLTTVTGVHFWYQRSKLEHKVLVFQSMIYL